MYNIFIKTLIMFTNSTGYFYITCIYDLKKSMLQVVLNENV